MPSNRSVGSAEEAVEFRPLPGFEDDWAAFNYVDRGGVWYWLGLFPIALCHIALLVLIGVVANG